MSNAMKLSERDEVRDMLNKRPLPGIIFTGNINEHYRSKRWLSLHDAAKRMSWLCSELEIGVKDNNEDHWTKELERAYKQIFVFNSQWIQISIFKIFRDEKFNGCLRIFADLGTLIDSCLGEDQK